MAISGGGLPPGFPNRGPISDQKMSFSTPVFRIGVYEILLLLLRLEHHTKDFLNFSLNLCYCSLFIYRELKLPRSYTPIVPWKTIPDSRAKFKPVFRPKRPKNHTLSGGTYRVQGCPHSNFLAHEHTSGVTVVEFSLVQAERRYNRVTAKKRFS